LTLIDDDYAYRISQEPQYDGTLVRRAFDTFADPPQYELYDLQNDPIEYHNLAGDPAYADVLQRMQHALLEYRENTDDPFLDPAFLKEYADGYLPPLPADMTAVDR
jgi:N-sulfoglucosamine sulfohydrolase